MNAMDQYGPFGQSIFNRDSKGNPLGIETRLDNELGVGADRVMGNFSNFAGLLPTSAFDSTTAAPNTDYISRTIYDRGRNLLDPTFQQARQEQDVNLTNRGLPIGSEARNISEGNLGRQQSLAYSDLASQASLAAPQEQQRLIGNARADYQMPYTTAASGLGLLSGLRGLTPNAAQPQASVQAPDYASGVWNAYSADMQNYQNQMSGLGQLFGTGANLLTTFL